MKPLLTSQVSDLTTEPPIIPSPTAVSANLSSRAKLKTLLPIFFAGLFMIVGILILVWIGRDRDQLTGSPLVDIDLHPLMHVDSELELEQLKGKVIVYHFWGPWCIDCIREYPEFSKLVNKYHAKAPDVFFVNVACSSGDENNRGQLKAEVEEFLQKHADAASQVNNIPIYCDPAMFTRANLVRSMPKGGFAYPTTILVDSTGLIRSVWRGQVNPMIVEREIERYRSASR